VLVGFMGCVGFVRGRLLLTRAPGGRSGAAVARPGGCSPRLPPVSPVSASAARRPIARRCPGRR
jgi:hypothetical protein